MDVTFFLFNQYHAYLMINCSGKVQSTGIRQIHKYNNTKHFYLPIVAGFTAVMIKSDPVCNTGDLITITLIHGGQIFSSSAKERNV